MSVKNFDLLAKRQSAPAVQLEKYHERARQPLKVRPCKERRREGCMRTGWKGGNDNELR